MKTIAALPVRKAMLPDALQPALFAILLATCPSASAGISDSPGSDEPLIYESAGASRVVELVRAEAQGIMVGVFVKTGDTVTKGQLLGHTELDATKFQLDLAQAALDAKGNVDAAKGQADAWSVTREETQEAVRKRRVEKTRLAWATAMEKMYQGTYEIQLDAEKAQLIQYTYWKEQYEKRFFRAPVDGVVSQVLVEPGKSVAIAAHAFTIQNDNLYSIPVTVPDEVARTATTGQTLPVRPESNKIATRALVGAVNDSPGKPGNKTVQLLIPINSFPASIRAKLIGTKFEVLFPLASANEASSRPEPTAKRPPGGQA